MLEQDIDRVLFTEEQLQARVAEIDRQMEALNASLEELLAAAGGSPGVLRCEILAG